jgi:hypothetical protein
MDSISQGAQEDNPEKFVALAQCHGIPLLVTIGIVFRPENHECGYALANFISDNSILRMTVWTAVYGRLCTGDVRVPDPLSVIHLAPMMWPTVR